MVRTARFAWDDDREPPMPDEDGDPEAFEDALLGELCRSLRRRARKLRKPRSRSPDSSQKAADPQPENSGGTRTPEPDTP